MRIEHQTWGLLRSSRDENVLTLPLQIRLRINENTVWTDSQDYGADEILFTSKNTLFHKTPRIANKITILFGVSPQLFLKSPNMPPEQALLNPRCSDVPTGSAHLKADPGITDFLGWHRLGPQRVLQDGSPLQRPIRGFLRAKAMPEMPPRRNRPRLLYRPPVHR